MKMYDIPIINLVTTIRKVAKKVYGKKARLGSRGRHGTPIYARIATLAYLVLNRRTPERLAKELEKNRALLKSLGLPWPVKARTINEWRRRLGKLIERLIRKTFEVIARWRGRLRSKAIVDTTGFKRGRASSHYEMRIGRKRKLYAKVIAVYSAEVDAVYTVGVDYDTMHDVRMAEGILPAVCDSGLFDGLVGDKGFDSSDLMESVKRCGLVPYIAVRGGKLEPRGGIRLESKRNFEALVAGCGNIRGLVESLFSSIKACTGDVVYSRRLEGFAAEIAVRFLAYNVGVIIKLEIPTTKL